MTQKLGRPIWQGIWGYKEAFVVCLGLVAVGILLQLTVGCVGNTLFSYPFNVLFGGAYLVVLVVLQLAAGKRTIIRWMGSSPTAITLMLMLGFTVLLMGVTPQRNLYEAPQGGFVSRIGLDAILHTWYFAFIFFFLLTSLGLTAVKRLVPFRKKNIGFVLNHLGLWLTLFAGVLGSGDIAQLTMNLTEGKVEWRAQDRQGVVYEMPIATELHDFTMEEYPANLYLIDTRTGDALPKEKPVHLALEDSLTKGNLEGWQIEVVSKMNDAAPVAADKYVRYINIGSCQAAYIKATSHDGRQKKEGWISSGSFMFPHKSLYLTDTLGLLMGVPEPKKFRSEVTIYSKTGLRLDTCIEVNRPVVVDGWTIYQLGYDDQMGRWSNKSTVEMVKDPWLKVVYTGLLMLLAGAVYLFWIANKQKREVRNVE
ncbi:cytochrome c biogenesis protein ResB [Alistipes sp. ZOR0009]|uniref:cytochrome c biogenesis protein ResB n=1 Tax=Alistipes sp. ZOR0009 TaxID=1339253 RepID=UPI00068E4256|nr:cytochrome c biogenesis protein ResB [Alistipes sp. ZOR0009]